MERKAECFVFRHGRLSDIYNSSQNLLFQNQPRRKLAFHLDHGWQSGDSGSDGELDVARSTKDRHFLFIQIKDKSLKKRTEEYTNNT